MKTNLSKFAGVSKVTTHVIQEMKNNKEKIAMLTAYDFSMGRLLDQAGIDVILVGDSASNVMAGHSSTLPITLNEMIYHASSVIRGVKRALVVVDLPFGTYQGNSKEALSSAIRIMKEAGADAVKVEGGKEILDSVKAIIDAKIPVVGHLGLMPQSINKIGGYKVQCRDEEAIKKLLEDSLALQQAGVFSIVLECIPEQVAKDITEKLDIPIIGIGAGRYCDGQVLVSDDMLGIFSDFTPKFVKKYAQLSQTITDAVKEYSQEVKNGKFPQESNTYK